MRNQLIIGIIFLSLFSCQKEKSSSICEDSDAQNYNYSSPCIFIGTGVFWYNESESIELQNSGSTSLNYFIDGSPVGNLSTDNYWDNTPACNDSNTISFALIQGANKTQNHTYTINNQNGNVVYSGNFTTTAGNCLPIQIQ